MIKRITSVAAIVAAFALTASAQTQKARPGHIGLVYPLSTNGVEAKEFTNAFSIHAIAGVSGGEKAFCVSGFSNVIFGQANGFTAAGFSNHIMEDNHGVTLAGFMNTVSGAASGFQAAGFANVAADMSGAQMAGFANISRSNAYGAQIAGFANIAYNTDVQLSGFMNVAKDASAAQVSGFVNIAETTKSQVGGFVNVAENVNTQIAGFINVAKDVKGMQMAGFINIAEHSDYPIGLVNIVKNGEKSIGVTMDESLTTMLALRTGGKVLYGILGLGFNTGYTDFLYGIEAGLGARLNVYKGFRVNFEASYTSLTNFTDYEHTYFKSSARILPSITIEKRVELFAGPVMSFSERGIFAGKLANTDIWETSRWGRSYGLGIGGIAGVQVRF